MTPALVLAETFLSFKDLARAYEVDVDYQINLSAGLNPKIAVVAPHGGAIEFPTSRVAAAIAGHEFSFYSFEGIREADNYAALHLRSERFDEPRCLELISGCDHVVTVHGCKGVDQAVLLGGRDKALGEEIAAALGAEGIYCKFDGHKFYGTDAFNICNRGRSRAGVQLELTSTLRNSPEAVAGVVRAVRNVLLRLVDAADGPCEPQP
ncbi:poly-gamma-glutamate hydrolase family protein [Curvibacter gracilis]|uniref:poly-gamma-glutamate hydrolase family protein n=1 Tax=Curvibacter gracilis TaxID=230310 RepID=UPI000686FD79|nr:poly-gamma-glutamate hydrolase family protein [Curvibacter gracilis]RUP25386.1 MAG: hypothetical protein EKK45_20085 [Curvibacter sp.]